MESKLIHLYKARDGDEAYRIRLEGDSEHLWRAQRGFGQDFEHVWTVEVVTRNFPIDSEIDWDVVLERTVAAWDMNDPVLAGFAWPRMRAAR